MKKLVLRSLHSLARARRYHLSSFSEQLTLEAHLGEQLSRWGIDLVIDVGANVGQYASMLRAIGYTGDIISVEPCRAAFTALQQASLQDARWKACQFAFGETEGQAILHLSQSSVFNSFHPANTFGSAAFPESIEWATTETVPMIRLERFLDEQVDSFSRRTAFLKMDTQGHDYAVFAGAGRYRNSFAGLQSELSVCPIYDGIQNYKEMLAVYEDAGYGITGLYAVNRLRETGHVIEFDCVMAPNETLRQRSGLHV